MYSNLKPETLEKRLRMAKSFNTKHFGNRSPSLEETQFFLEQVSPNYRKGSWRNLRNALATHWWAMGEATSAQKIRQTINPDSDARKPKQIRCKNVTHDDFIEMMQTCNVLRNWTALSTLYIANFFGCRPSEMNNIQVLGEQRFLITGAKKRDDRGLDRVVEVDDLEIANCLTTAIEEVQNIPTRKLQSAIDYVSEKTFPKRKARPTIYTFRHTLGSTLKAAGVDREFVAYLMGHQSTASVDQYGDRRSGKGRTFHIFPGVEVDEVLSLIREKHRRPYSYRLNNMSPHA